jgi:hypothetical protein
MYTEAPAGEAIQAFQIMVVFNTHHKGRDNCSTTLLSGTNGAGFGTPLALFLTHHQSPLCDYYLFQLDCHLSHQS